MFRVFDETFRLSYETLSYETLDIRNLPPDDLCHVIVFSWQYAAGESRKRFPRYSAGLKEGITHGKHNT